MLSIRVAKGDDQDAEIELRLLDTDEARYLKVYYSNSTLLLSSIIMMYFSPSSPPSYIYQP